MVEQVVGGLGPDERVAALVPTVDERTDRSDQVFDAAEAAATDGLAGDDREEHLDQVQPRPRGRREVQGDPRVAGQPCAHGGVVVRDLVAQHEELDVLGGRRADRQ